MQVAQRGCGCHSPASVDGWVGWGFEEPEEEGWNKDGL